MIFLIEFLHIYIYIYIYCWKFNKFGGLSQPSSPVVYLRDIFSVFTVTYIPRKHWCGYRGCCTDVRRSPTWVRWVMPLPGYRCRIRNFYFYFYFFYFFLFFFFSFLDMRWFPPTRANLCQFRLNRIVSASRKWSIQADTGFESSRNSSKNYYFYKKSAKTSLNKK